MTDPVDWEAIALEDALADLDGLDDPEFFDVVLRGNPPPAD